MLSLSFKLSKNKGVNWAWCGDSPVQNRAVLLGAAERSLAGGLAWYCGRAVLLAEGAPRSCGSPPKQPEEQSQKACNPRGFGVDWEKPKKQKTKPTKKNPTTHHKAYLQILLGPGKKGNYSEKWESNKWPWDLGKPGVSLGFGVSAILAQTMKPRGTERSWPAKATPSSSGQAFAC